MSTIENGVECLTRKEQRELFDGNAREKFGISGAEFARRFDDGEFRDDTPDQIHMSMMRPFGPTTRKHNVTENRTPSTKS